MLNQTIAIAFFGLVAIWFGITVFRTSSMVRSALALLGSMAAVGAMFLAMEAEFLGVLQIMMMASEMTIMAIFMVMYMMDPGGMGRMDMSHQKRISLVAGAGGALAGVLLAVLSSWGPIASAVPSPGIQTQQLGINLLGQSMIVFETAGTTILLAMIVTTAVAIARQKQ